MAIFLIQRWKMFVHLNEKKENEKKLIWTMNILLYLIFGASQLSASHLPDLLSSLRFENGHEFKFLSGMYVCNRPCPTNDCNLLANDLIEPLFFSWY